MLLENKSQFSDIGYLLLALSHADAPQEVRLHYRSLRGRLLAVRSYLPICLSGGRQKPEATLRLETMDRTFDEPEHCLDERTSEEWSMASQLAAPPLKPGGSLRPRFEKQVSSLLFLKRNVR
jgi:hypothetical protein